MIARSITIVVAGILSVSFLAPALAGKGSSSSSASTRQQKFSAPYKPSGTNKGGGGPGVLTGKRVTGQKVLNLKKQEEQNSAGRQKQEDLKNKKKEEAQEKGQQEKGKPAAKNDSGNSSPVDVFMPSAKSGGTAQKSPSDPGKKDPRDEKEVRAPDDHRELKATSGVSGGSSSDVQRARGSN